MTVIKSKYVGKYGGGLRLLVPRKDGKYDAIYLPHDISEHVCKGLLESKLKEYKFEDYEIRRLMGGWSDEEQSRIKLNRQINNRSGYLGVSFFVNGRALGYTSSYVVHGDTKDETFRTRTYPYGDRYCISNLEIKRLFVRACKASDRMRGHPIKSSEYYEKHYVKIDWEKQFKRHFELNGKQYPGLVITERPESNYAYEGRLYRSKKEIERSLGIAFNLSEVPEEKKQSVEGWNDWIARKVSGKHGNSIAKMKFEGVDSSGYSAVLTTTKEAFIGYSVPIIVQSEHTGEFRDFHVPLYPYKENLSYSIKELKYAYIDACRESDTQCGERLKADSSYLATMKNVDWGALVSKAKRSRGRSLKGQMIETNNPQSNIMLGTSAFQTIGDACDAVGIGRIKFKKDFKKEDVSDELLEVVSSVYVKE